jgi:RND family efflux transporter MFP subunit
MKFRIPNRLTLGLLLGLMAGLAGCAKAPVAAPAAESQVVAVSPPVEQYVTDYAVFTGWTAAVDSVELRARVWGYLNKVNFQEGALVKKGDVLFEIEPRTYQAALDQAQGNVSQFEARLTRLEADRLRAVRLLAKGAMSQEEYDRTVGDRGEAAGSLAAYRATVDRARLDLDYTKVIAPISGRVSRYVVTAGNLVQAGDQGGGTLLTTIVSVDPMYAYFDVDEQTVLRVRQLIREGKAKSARDGELPVWLGLANEEGYPHPGTINFVDNQINLKTGTLRLRGVFPNQEEVLSPGNFVRVRVPIGFAHQALLVADRAIDNDQGEKIVYVVDNDNKVVSRPVRLGALHDGLREITSGLNSGELVVVNGLQQVSPGAIVEPKLVAMPVALAANPRSPQSR